MAPIQTLRRNTASICSRLCGNGTARVVFVSIDICWRLIVSNGRFLVEIIKRRRLVTAEMEQLQTLIIAANMIITMPSDSHNQMSNGSKIKVHSCLMYFGLRISMDIEAQSKGLETVIRGTGS